MEAAWLAAGKSPNTIRLAHATLRAALSQAVAWKLVERNEATLVKAPPSPVEPMRALSAEETARVLLAADKTRLAAFWHVAAACSLRRGELLGLQWSDVDFVRETVSIQRQVARHGGEWVVCEPKTKRSKRLVVLPEPVMAALKAHRARQNAERRKAGPLWQGEEGWVFADEVGRRVKKEAIDRAHVKLEAASGVGHFRLHDLRHTGATLALAAGVHPKIVQEMLGHSTVAMTLDRYSHVAESMQREAAKAIGDLLERAKAASS
ncbi:MAG TPA: site-specific integrase [Thermomicrobiales bacterium]|nr:site-specific integrase [Thermomicrobiales bacterium]